MWQSEEDLYASETSGNYQQHIAKLGGVLERRPGPASSRSEPLGLNGHSHEVPLRCGPHHLERFRSSSNKWTLRRRAGLASGGAVAQILIATRPLFLTGKVPSGRQGSGVVNDRDAAGQGRRRPGRQGDIEPSPRRRLAL